MAIGTPHVWMRGRWDRWIPWGLGLAFLLLYLRTLCPTVYLGDAGEISTAIATGGIIHPPGYPLFSLLGRIALALVPCGEPAFRIGCVVAAAAAATIVALYFLARETGASRWASAAGAAAFGLSHTFWSQSTRVEVYSLHSLLVCLLLWSALCYRRTGSLSLFVAVILAGSLGLAHHLTIALLGPGVLLLCGRRLWVDEGRGRRLLALCALLPVGPALYLLLLVWARAEPLQAWGHPVTLSLLWNHASARFYHGFLQIPDAPHLWHQLARTGVLFADTFPYLTFLLPLLGAWALWKRDRGLTTGLLLAALGVVVFNLCYRIDDIASYFLAAWIVDAALLALALDVLQGCARGRWGAATLAVGLCSLLVMGPLLRNWGNCDLSRATWVREFALQKLKNADPGSVLISATDDDTFPLWYVHDLLKVRPDVFHVDRMAASSIWSKCDRDPSLWYAHRLRRQGINAPLDRPRDLATLSYLGDDGYLIDLLRHELRGRPICMTFFGSDAPLSKDRRVFFSWAAKRYAVLPVGLLMRLQPRNRPVDLQALIAENERQWAKMPLPDLHGARTDDEIEPNFVSDRYACGLVNFGGLYEMAGDRARAETLYRRAAEWAPSYQPAVAALAALRRSPFTGNGRAARG